MTTKSEMKDQTIEDILCLVESINKIKDCIKKVRINDPKDVKTIYYSLQNLSDTLKIYKRDIDYQLKYDDHFWNIE